MKNKLLYVGFLLIAANCYLLIANAQTPTVEKVDPPNWWADYSIQHGSCDDSRREFTISESYGRKRFDDRKCENVRERTLSFCRCDDSENAVGRKI